MNRIKIRDAVSVCKLLIVILLTTFALIDRSLAINNIPEKLKSTVSPPKPDAVSWMLAEQSTGWVLAQHNADKRIAPASLSKIMTSYVVFEALKNGTIKLDDKVRISEKAWRTGGSRMFLNVDSNVTIEDLIRGLVIQSGNDASVALAEYVAGDLSGFSEMMNQTARKLGMTNSNFTNPNGLPDPDHYTTATDLLILTRALIKEFPEYYKWYKEKEFTFNEITQKNRNRLLWQDENIDGVKTGHTQEAGYCLVGSSVENGMRLTAIVTGADSVRARTRAVESLLRFGHNYYEYIPVYENGDAVTELPVYKGVTKTTTANITENVSVLVPKGQSNKLTAQITTQKHIIAPQLPNSEIGKLVLNFEEQTINEFPLVIGLEVEEGPIWSRWIDGVKLWWQE